MGRTIGVDALAAVGCTGSISFLILGFAQGLTSGLSIITAQRFGAQDMDGIRKSFAHSAVISLGVTVVLTAIALPAACLLYTSPATPMPKVKMKTGSSTIFSTAPMSKVNMPVQEKPWQMIKWFRHTERTEKKVPDT